MSEETNSGASASVKEKLPVFTFQRMGGLDQVVLLNDEEWQNLDKLDPKLWMALSCPIEGLEFSRPTLELLDTDHNGRVRAQEVSDAVDWVCARLLHPSCLRESTSDLKLEDLREDTDAGQALRKAADLALEKQAREKTESLKLPEIEAIVTEAAAYPFNGDGIVPPDSAPAPTNGDEGLNNTRNYITMALSLVGAMKDASGKPGLNEDLVKELDSRLQAVLDWRDSIKHAHLPLGDKTGAAWTLLQKVGPKLDDYFSRCNLAAFSPETLSRISDSGKNGEETQSASLPNTLISPSTLLELPLAKINPDAVLDLQRGLNPAWRSEIQDFCNLVAPLAGGSLKKLDEKTWNTIKGEFSEYGAVLASKPEWAAPDPDADQVTYPDCPPLALAPASDPLKRNFLPLQPTESLGELSDEQIKTMLSPKLHEDFSNLVKKDLEAPPLASFEDLRKLMLYKGNLYTFLRNFLSFLDFYEPDKKAIFQTGTLYLDSRSCKLCVPVEDVENHARLSASSHLCLIYCECHRQDSAGVEYSSTIAAAMTAGTLAALIDGRHGLFIDNYGNEWDTKIIQIVHNPISLREAVWAPYIRVSNMIGEQIQKFVASKEESVGELTTKATTSLTSAADKPAAAAAVPAAPTPKEGFDFAKNAGIFAALSVALSVLSAAFAYIANSVASLGWWWPLAIIIIFLCISGPSVVSAWFKLRKRSLGPLLDASGWAVNKGAPINLVMGASLTQVGKLPPNSTRDVNDPYTLPEILRAKKRRAWIKFIIFLLILACCGAFWFYCWFWGQPAWFSQILSWFNA